MLILLLFDDADDYETDAVVVIVISFDVVDCVVYVFVWGAANYDGGNLCCVLCVCVMLVLSVLLRLFGKHVDVCVLMLLIMLVVSLCAVYMSLFDQTWWL